jgi:hypothetical protein
MREQDYNHKGLFGVVDDKKKSNLKIGCQTKPIFEKWI